MLILCAIFIAIFHVATAVEVQATVSLTTTVSNQTCNSTECPVDGAWSSWQTDKGCTVSCGIGVSLFTRECNNPYPAYLGKDCPGTRSKTEYCQLKECPVHGQWSEWTTGDCSVSCGGGFKQTIRHCNNPEPQNGGNNCVGDDRIEEKCNEEMCISSYVCLKSWIPYNKKCYLDLDREAPASIADNDCYNLDNTKSHPPILMQAKDADFYKTPGLLLSPQNRSYWLGAFREDNDYLWTSGEKFSSGYTNWDDDHPTSKDGVVITSNGKWIDVSHRLRYSVVCQKDAIKVNWGPFSNCNGDCGGGSGTQTRSPDTCEGHAANCIGLNETRSCINMTPCPIDGGWTLWGIKSCGVSCGSGLGIFFRTCSAPEPEHKGKYCLGSAQKTDICNEKPCPIDGGWNNWQAVDGIACTTTCGVGIKLLKRTCNNPYPSYGGASCIGDENKHEYCKLEPCYGPILMQQRVDDSLSFNKSWIEYENGFGSPNGNYWLGLKEIYSLTKTGSVKIRFEMKKYNDDTLYWAEYDKFSIGGVSNNYRLSISDYNRLSTAGDSMITSYGSINLNGMQFSTRDRDNDRWSSNSCSQYHHGNAGWWFNSCSYSNPNGVYHNSRTHSATSIYWYDLDKGYSLRYFRILLIP